MMMTKQPQFAMKKQQQQRNKAKTTRREAETVFQLISFISVRCSDCVVVWYELCARDETTNIIWFVIDGDRCVCPTYSITHRLRLHMRTGLRFVRARLCVFRSLETRTKSNRAEYWIALHFVRRNWPMHTMARRSYEMVRVNCTNYDDESTGISRNVSYLSRSRFALRPSRTRFVCDDEWTELLVAQITREVVKP